MVDLQRLKDWALLILCNLIWASQFVMVKLVQREMGPVFATFFPMTLATVILFVVVKSRRGEARPALGARMPRRDVLDFLLIGVFGQVAAQLFITWGTGLSLASNAASRGEFLPKIRSTSSRRVTRVMPTSTTVAPGFT